MPRTKADLSQGWQADSSNRSPSTSPTSDNSHSLHPSRDSQRVSEPTDGANDQDEYDNRVPGVGIPSSASRATGASLFPHPAQASAWTGQGGSSWVPSQLGGLSIGPEGTFSWAEGTGTSDARHSSGDGSRETREPQAFKDTELSKSAAAGLRDSVYKDACAFNKAATVIRREFTNPCSTRDISQHVHKAFSEAKWTSARHTLASDLKESLTATYDELGRAKEIIDEDVIASGRVRTDRSDVDFEPYDAIDSRKQAFLKRLDDQVQIARAGGTSLGTPPSPTSIQPPLPAQAGSHRPWPLTFGGVLSGMTGHAEYDSSDSDDSSNASIRG
ncbi:hypothetical protein I317_02184 [Kwoniella heveanensis CBS 569]|nr:hypothetical protein I317_02184 [Kwoniella heveanensis CBS 569]